MSKSCSSHCAVHVRLAAEEGLCGRKVLFRILHALIANKFAHFKHNQSWSVTIECCPEGPAVQGDLRTLNLVP